MQKNYFITIIMCLLAIGITAQPIITYNGNAPQLGDTYNASGIPTGGSFDPGPAGGGQSWDFSDVQATISAGAIAVDPASTPFVDDFPNATIAFQDSDTSYESYSYSQISPSEMFYIGMAFDPGETSETSIHYIDAKKIMQYPFSYNNTFTDTYYYSYPSTIMLIHRRGTITATADAWGSVKTPVGTYNSTLRVKKEKVYTDSVWNIGGDLMSVTTHSLTDYEWYTATSHYPVLSIEVTDAGASSLSYTSLVGGIEDKALLSQINVYPNPATDVIIVQPSDGITNIEEINIISITGQQLIQLTETENRQFSADISELTAGVYFLRIKNSSGKFSTSKFIKK